MLKLQIHQITKPFFKKGPTLLKSVNLIFPAEEENPFLLATTSELLVSWKQKLKQLTFCKLNTNCAHINFNPQKIFNVKKAYSVYARLQRQTEYNTEKQ